MNASFYLKTDVFGGVERVAVRLQKHRRQHGWTCTN